MRAAAAAVAAAASHRRLWKGQEDERRLKVSLRRNINGSHLGTAPSPQAKKSYRWGTAIRIH
ncbi:hypothetical protein E2C01_018988 [Portunus trituberculatus]|uniref:Uncharacterized protein n=1 Tax=Portunus trituberculatus TaxID=210409 RepID=A0A5B7DX33_PORTR|nr:hypothetical protein [Portunus trituberculatus]